MSHLLADREGNITEENTFQDRFLEILYGHWGGRLLLKPLVSPLVSEIGGAFLDSGISGRLIKGFIRNHSIDMGDYREKEYRSYNDFFTRRMKPDARRVDNDPEVLISPCDARLSVYRIGEDSAFCVKHTSYTAESLLRSRKLAEQYAGGTLWMFRLCVEDYHRYIYPDGGRVSSPVRIPGVLHTVNPVANDHFPIYKENTREYVLLRTERLGTLLQMEVGALMVGKIVNHKRGNAVQRGWEKGHFAFGGSTILLMTEKGAVRPDQDILANSAKGAETKVRLGERVGTTPAFWAQDR